MKTKFTLAIGLICFSQSLFAQFSNALIGKFGIDGDVYANTRLLGTWSAAGSWDWFKNNSGTGSGIIDTLGASALRAQLSAGQNITFSKGMNVPKFTIKDGMIMMDARYSRDHFGNSAGNDLTMFTLGAKNGDNPATWGTNPTGASLQDKVDIIDAYTYMWRDGTSMTATRPSNLFLAIGASTLSNTGSRYIDFEMFVAPITYNSTTGQFTNTSPASTGGHAVWQFNPNGSIFKIGDLTISYSFSSAMVEDISMYIWTSRSTFDTAHPALFDFVPTEFWGATNGAAYGYAKIVPKPGFEFPGFGAVNTNTILGPVWGTASKNIGNVATAYFANHNSPGQFAETTINLTKLGIDPIFLGGTDICSPIFRKVMIKSRSSSSFSSALADFTMPIGFVDASLAPVDIATPQVLTCDRRSVQLMPNNINPFIYKWTTSNGYIVGRTDTAIITVNKPGKYYLSVSFMAGCPFNKDSVIVTQDIVQPVATATTFGSLNPLIPTSTVNVVGGDEAASQVITPHGGSAGLTWSWTGPAGFPGASTKDFITGIEGNYTLILTELRNGCKDTAVTPVYSFYVLPLRIISFTATRKTNSQVSLHLRFNDQQVATPMELLRSEDGIHFRTVAYFTSRGTAADDQIHWTDHISQTQSPNIYYKMKVSEPNGRFQYSDIAVVHLREQAENISLYPNPVQQTATITFQHRKKEMASINLTDIYGKTVYRRAVQLQEGMNQVRLENLSGLSAGRYQVSILGSEQKYQLSLIKQ